MSFSDFLENAVLDHIFTDPAYSPPATLYVALSTADPLDTGAGIAEPVGNAYQRVGVTAATFSAASGGVKTNTATISFPQATGSWGTITHFAIFDDQSTGNFLAHGNLTTAKPVNTDDTASFAAGQFTLNLT